MPAGRGVLSPAPSVAGRRFKAPKREETPLQSLKTRSASPPPPPCPSCCLFISLFLTELDFAVRVSPPSSRTSARLFLLYSPFSLSLLLWNSSSFNNPEITDSHFPPSRRLSHAWSKTALSGPRLCADPSRSLSLSLPRARSLASPPSLLRFVPRAPPRPPRQPGKHKHGQPSTPTPPPTLTHPGTETLSSRFSLSVFSRPLSLKHCQKSQAGSCRKSKDTGIVSE